MMRLTRTSIAGMIALACWQSSSAEEDKLKDASGRLAAAAVAAYQCQLDLNDEVADGYLSKMTGRTSFTQADVMSVIGSVSFYHFLYHQNWSDKKWKAEACKDFVSQFGPSGKDIPNLLKQRTK